MQYQVRAVNAQRQLVSLVLECSDEAAARAQLRQQALTVVSVAALGQSARRARFPLLLFVQELHALLIAGLSVAEALDVLIEKESNESARSTLQAVAEDLRSGQRLSSALARQSGTFPPLLIGILRAAEGTSDLPQALARYRDYETRLDTVRQKVVSAAIYPAILVCAGGGVAAFLLGYVVPRFAAVYRGAGRPLPWASQLLLDWGAFASAHSLQLGALVITLAAVATWWIRKHLIAGTWWRALAVIPGARPKLETLEVARLYLTLGMLLQGGLPIGQALELAKSVVAPASRVRIDAVARSIEQGTMPSEAFAAAGFMTPVAARLLKVAERSGQLGAMLVRAAEFHENETARWIERFAKSFEPLLMAAIGLVIGVIVILLYMPIFDLAGAVQ